MEFINWVVAHKAVILGVVVGIDTVLAEIPFIKASSTFQLFTSLIAKLKGDSTPAAK